MQELTEKKQKPKNGFRQRCKSYSSKKQLVPHHNLNRIPGKNIQYIRNELRSPQAKKSRQKNMLGELRQVRSEKKMNLQRKVPEIKGEQKMKRNKNKEKKMKSKSKNKKSKTRSRRKSQNKQKFMTENDIRDDEYDHIQTIKIPLPQIISNGPQIINNVPTSKQNFNFIQGSESARRLGRLKPKVKDPFQKRMKLDCELKKESKIPNIPSGVSLAQTETDQYKQFLNHF